MRIVIDTREQRPYTFAGHEVIVGTLPAGDYSIEGFETRFAIERKQDYELFGNFGRGRDTFRREWEKLAEYDRAILLVENTLAGLTLPPRGKVRPATVINSLVSWGIRYGVHVVFAGDRTHAQRIALRYLEAYWRFRADPVAEYPRSASADPAP